MICNVCKILSECNSLSMNNKVTYKISFINIIIKVIKL